MYIWKNSYHASADVSMLGYGCGVSMYPQFFVEDLKTYHMLPLPYISSFDGGPTDQVLKQKWVLELANRAETFVLERIESMIMSDYSREKNLTYWSTLKEKLEKAKEILPSTCRIGETIFTSMAVIGGKLYRNHPKNMNHVHKDIKDLVSVIITLWYLVHLNFFFMKVLCGVDTEP